MRSDTLLYSLTGILGVLFVCACIGIAQILTAPQRSHGGAFSNNRVHAAENVATLSLSTPTTVKPGDKVSAELRIDTGGQTVRTVSVEVSYDNLTFADFTAGNTSFPTERTKPEALNNTLLIERENISGYKGTGGIIGTLNFTAPKEGRASIRINATNSEAADLSNKSLTLEVGQGSTITVGSTADATSATTSAPDTEPQIATTSSTASTSENATDIITAIPISTDTTRAATQELGITNNSNAPSAAWEPRTGYGIAVGCLALSLFLFAGSLKLRNA